MKLDVSLFLGPSRLELRGFCFYFATGMDFLVVMW